MMDVKTEINHLSATQKELVVEASAQVVEQEFRNVYLSLGRHAKVAGFRPGKVPQSVLKQRYGRQARETVANQLLPQLVQAALTEHQLRLVSDPKIQHLSLQQGEPVKFRVTVDVLPQLDAMAYRGLRVKRRVKAVSDADVDRALESLRQQYAELVPVEGRPAETGDIATLKLSRVAVSSQTKGDPLSGQPEMIDLEIGGEDVLPAFTDALKGMRVGETRRFTVAYPADYRPPSLAGQEIEYEATLETLCIKEYPPLDEEFVKTVGEDFDTLADFRRELKRRLQQSNEEEAEAALSTAVLEELIRTHPIDAPETLVHRRLEARLRNMAHSMAQQGIDPRSEEIDWEALTKAQRENAVHDVQAWLLLQRLAEVENLTVSTTEVDAEIAGLAAQLRETPTHLKRRLTKEGSLDSIKEEMLNRKALALVVKEAGVEPELVHDDSSSGSITTMSVGQTRSTMTLRNDEGNQ